LHTSSDPKAQGNRSPNLRNCKIGDISPQSVQQLDRNIEPGFGQQNRKFFSAPTGNVIGRPQAIAHEFGQLSEDGVSGRVPEGVVDDLEMVDIPDRHAQRPVVPTGSRDFLLEAYRRRRAGLADRSARRR
jgi:hypothetical protein